MLNILIISTMQENSLVNAHPNKKQATLNGTLDRVTVYVGPSGKLEVLLAPPIILYRAHAFGGSKCP